MSVILKREKEDLPMKKHPSPDKLARGLTILILLLFCLSAGCIVYRSLSDHPENTVAEIYQDGILVMTIPLSEKREPYTLTISGKDGAYNVIQVKDGKIGIISASCPDKICVKQGFQDKSLFAITCLPNHLVIRIKSAADGKASEEISPDAVTY